MSPEKPWTVMVYLAGDNNLDGAGVVDLNEMKKVGSSHTLNVIAQFDRSGKTRQTKRYCLRRGGSLARDVVASLGETNTGDPGVFRSFIEWGFRDFPAKHFLLVVWNHGNGWDDEEIYRIAKRDLRLTVTRRGVALGREAAGDSVPLRSIRSISGRATRRALFRTSVQSAVRMRGIAYDDNAKDFLDNKEMKRVLASAADGLGRKIDILGMDACLMSMAEVAYQLRDSVGLTVGSEEIEPGEGWPYDTILADLASKPSMTPRTLAATIVDRYLRSYPAGANVTQAACDLGRSASMASAVDRLAKALIGCRSDGPLLAAALKARTQVQSYDTPDYVDLCDFCDLLEDASRAPGVVSACRAVKTALLDEGFILRSGFKGPRVRHSRGLSIYFPQKSVSTLYSGLDLAKHTAWGNFLNAYLAATRRP